MGKELIAPTQCPLRVKEINRDDLRNKPSRPPTKDILFFSFFGHQFDSCSGRVERVGSLPQENSLQLSVGRSLTIRMLFPLLFTCGLLPLPWLRCLPLAYALPWFWIAGRYWALMALYEGEFLGSARLLAAIGW
jgi:hypothetical protein